MALMDEKPKKYVDGETPTAQVTTNKDIVSVPTQPGGKPEAVVGQIEKSNYGAGNTTVAPTTSPATSTTDPGTTAGNSKVYIDTMETLQAAEKSPPSFTSDYDQQISDLYAKITSREPFKYDYSSDPLYGNYQQQYMQQGKQAMQDTMGQVAALTGGYGSSYGQAVGQQQYDAYVQRLTDVLPELYGQAYEQYVAEGDELQKQLALASDLRNTEYQQYRDDKGDKQYEDAWALQQAETRAQYGDFGGFADLYGEDEANKMRLTWAAANPDAAYTAGTITADEYYLLTGKKPRKPGGNGSGGGSPWDYGGVGWNPGYQLSIDGISPDDWKDREEYLNSLG